MSSRAVSWGDLHNAWDLGGLPTAFGSTRYGRIFRSMDPDKLDTAGWEDVRAAGITTVVDLRNDYEVKDAPDRPTTLTIIRRPIEDQSDAEFMAEWGERLGSPAYYPEILRRWPDLVAAAIASIADATGPVLFHCGAGRDRTGMISALICTLREWIVGIPRRHRGGGLSRQCWDQSGTAQCDPFTTARRLTLVELSSCRKTCPLEAFLLAKQPLRVRNSCTTVVREATSSRSAAR